MLQVISKWLQGSRVTSSFGLVEVAGVENVFSHFFKASGVNQILMLIEEFVKVCGLL